MDHSMFTNHVTMTFLNYLSQLEADHECKYSMYCGSSVSGLIAFRLLYHTPLSDLYVIVDLMVEIYTIYFTQRSPILKFIDLLSSNYIYQIIELLTNKKTFGDVFDDYGTSRILNIALKQDDQVKVYSSADPIFKDVKVAAVIYESLVNKPPPNIAFKIYEMYHFENCSIVYIGAGHFVGTESFTKHYLVNKERMYEATKADTLNNGDQMNMNINSLPDLNIDSDPIQRDDNNLKSFSFNPNDLNDNDNDKNKDFNKNNLNSSKNKNENNEYFHLDVELIKYQSFSSINLRNYTILANLVKDAFYSNFECIEYIESLNSSRQAVQKIIKKTVPTMLEAMFQEIYRDIYNYDYHEKNYYYRICVYIHTQNPYLFKEYFASIAHDIDPVYDTQLYEMKEHLFKVLHLEHYKTMSTLLGDLKQEAQFMSILDVLEHLQEDAFRDTNKINYYLYFWSASLVTFVWGNILQDDRLSGNIYINIFLSMFSKVLATLLLSYIDSRNFNYPLCLNILLIIMYCYREFPFYIYMVLSGLYIGILFGYMSIKTTSKDSFKLVTLQAFLNGTILSILFWTKFGLIIRWLTVVVCAFALVVALFAYQVSDVNLTNVHTKLRLNNVFPIIVFPFAFLNSAMREFTSIYLNKEVIILVRLGVKIVVFILLMYILKYNHTDKIKYINMGMYVLITVSCILYVVIDQVQVRTVVITYVMPIVNNYTISQMYAEYQLINEVHINVIMLVICLLLSTIYFAFETEINLTLYYPYYLLITALCYYVKIKYSESEIDFSKISKLLQSITSSNDNDNDQEERIETKQNVDTEVDLDLNVGVTSAKENSNDPVNNKEDKAFLTPSNLSKSEIGLLVSIKEKEKDNNPNQSNQSNQSNNENLIGINNGQSKDKKDENTFVTLSIDEDPKVMQKSVKTKTNSNPMMNRYKAEGEQQNENYDLYVGVNYTGANHHEFNNVLGAGTEIHVVDNSHLEDNDIDVNFNEDDDENDDEDLKER